MTCEHLISIKVCIIITFNQTFAKSDIYLSKNRCQTKIISKYEYDYRSYDRKWRPRKSNRKRISANKNDLSPKRNVVSFKKMANL